MEPAAKAELRKNRTEATAEDRPVRASPPKASSPKDNRARGILILLRSGLRAYPYRILGSIQP